MIQQTGKERKATALVAAYDRLDNSTTDNPGRGYQRGGAAPGGASAQRYVTPDVTIAIPVECACASVGKKHEVRVTLSSDGGRPKLVPEPAWEPDLYARWRQRDRFRPRTFIKHITTTCSEGDTGVEMARMFEGGWTCADARLTILKAIQEGRGEPMLEESYTVNDAWDSWREPEATMVPLWKAAGLPWVGGSVNSQPSTRSITEYLLIALQRAVADTTLLARYRRDVTAWHGISQEDRSPSARWTRLLARRARELHITEKYATVPVVGPLPSEGYGEGLGVYLTEVGARQAAAVREQSALEKIMGTNGDVPRPAAHFLKGASYTYADNRVWREAWWHPQFQKERYSQRVSGCKLCNSKVRGVDRHLASRGHMRRVKASFERLLEITFKRKVIWGEYGTR